ncbi:hypothetical protein E2562_003220 [Oryza meyeriana var. granulata]|uniref:Uncharacterized protein n=1 Tax=Oryza meyeriana var. granulata TaxID=110450 RepID=A0A6G1EV09_9ORYZ|nr:hypothetical protein E2562_003220 [Oryza meyeriana var. granulata]
MASRRATKSIENDGASRGTITLGVMMGAATAAAEVSIGGVAGMLEAGDGIDLVGAVVVGTIVVEGVAHPDAGTASAAKLSSLAKIDKRASRKVSDGRSIKVGSSWRPKCRADDIADSHGSGVEGSQIR